MRKTIEELETKKLKLQIKRIDLIGHCADRNDKRILRQEAKILKEIASLAKQIKELKCKNK